MAVTRRGFLQSTAGAAGALASLSGRPTWQQELEASTSQPSTVRVLGPEATRPLQKLVRSLSDDVFARVCQTFTGRTCRLLEHQRLGLMAPSGKILNTQAQTSVMLSAEFADEHPPWFDMESFRRSTNNWTLGPMINIGWDSARPGPLSTLLQDNREETFAGITIMGMPYFPSGVEWAAHYVDERTGAFMRAIASYEINTDQVVGRWDVICG